MQVFDSALELLFLKLKVAYAYNFFDQTSSLCPPDSKTNEYNFTHGHFLKMKQIQNERFLCGASICKTFYTIKNSGIVFLKK